MEADVKATAEERNALKVELTLTSNPNPRPESQP